MDTVYLTDPQQPSPGQVIVTGDGPSTDMEYPGTHPRLITHGCLLSQRRQSRNKRSKSSQEIYSLPDLDPGGYVVHPACGISVFEGIHGVSIQDIIEDYLKLCYAEGGTLYMPIAQLDLVSEYIDPRKSA